jgi:hypothetical protein
MYLKQIIFNLVSENTNRPLFSKYTFFKVGIYEIGANTVIEISFPSKEE